MQKHHLKMVAIDFKMLQRFHDIIVLATTSEGFTNTVCQLQAGWPVGSSLLQPFWNIKLKSNNKFHKLLLFKLVHHKAIDMLLIEKTYLRYVLRGESLENVTLSGNIEFFAM